MATDGYRLEGFNINSCAAFIAGEVGRAFQKKNPSTTPRPPGKPCPPYTAVSVFPAKVAVGDSKEGAVTRRSMAL